MGTPFPGLQHRDGGGGVAVMVGPVKAMEPTPSKTCLKNSSLEPSILIFLFFHKAIRFELERLHHAAVTFAIAGGDIKPLFDRYHFLQAIYKHHCNVEDEDTARDILKNAPGVVVIDDRVSNHFPTPLEVSNKDDVAVGRIRRDVSQEGNNGLDIFVCGDQIRK